jgi:repressor LexA
MIREPARITMAGVEPTARQTLMLDFIKSFSAERGYSPSVRDIMDALEIRSPNGVVAHLKALEKRGLITRDHKLSRSIRVVAPATPGRCSCCGQPMPKGDA